MVSHGKGPTLSEKMGSNKTGDGSSSVPAVVRGNYVSQPRRAKIWLKRHRGRGRVAPVDFDDLDR
jgi:hypothetical protein